MVPWLCFRLETYTTNIRIHYQQNQYLLLYTNHRFYLSNKSFVIMDIYHHKLRTPEYSTKNVKNLDHIYYRPVICIIFMPRHDNQKSSTSCRTCALDLAQTDQMRAADVLFCISFNFACVRLQRFAFEIQNIFGFASVFRCFFFVLVPKCK